MSGLKYGYRRSGSRIVTTGYYDRQKKSAMRLVTMKNSVPLALGGPSHVHTGGRSLYTWSSHVHRFMIAFFRDMRSEEWVDGYGRI